jgi:hypothetical protein
MNQWLKKSWRILMLISIIILSGWIFWQSRPRVLSVSDGISFQDIPRYQDEIVTRMKSFSQLLAFASQGKVDPQKIEEFEKNLLHTKTKIKKIQTKSKESRKIREYFLISLKHLENGIIDLNRYLQTKNDKDFYQAQDDLEKSNEPLYRATELVTGIDL